MIEKDWLIDTGVATQFFFGSWNTNAINLKYLFSDADKVTISGGQTKQGPAKLGEDQSKSPSHGFLRELLPL